MFEQCDGWYGIEPHDFLGNRNECHLTDRYSAVCERRAEHGSHCDGPGSCEGQTVYVSVLARNRAGLSTVGRSDGVFVASGTLFSQLQLPVEGGVAPMCGSTTNGHR